MANIMITKRCNLHCEYCFANEFVNMEDGSTDIVISDFKKIADFILGDGSEDKIGLIGGEPTLHPELYRILDVLQEDVRVKKVTLYTNGIQVGDYVEKLADVKFHLLINCNDIAKEGILWKRFLESLDRVFANMPERVVLGANFYKPDYDYTYLMELLKKYHCKRLRVSISVPNSKAYNYNPLEYFADIKPRIFEFFRKLRELGTVPFLDCNIFPACLVTAEEMREFDVWGVDNPLSIIKNRQTGCIPVVDILPDFTSVRCFGLSEYTKENIRDFASISDLRNYYLRTVDAYAVNSTYDSKCILCYKYKTLKCSGGCLIYKIDRIIGKREEAR